MASKIILRQGLKKDLPTLDSGEIGFCTDTKEIFIGSLTGNVLIGKDLITLSRLGISNSNKLTIDGVEFTNGSSIQGPAGPQGPKGDTGTQGPQGIQGPQGLKGDPGNGILVFNTLSDLQATYPNGVSQPVWVIADNDWYYWNGTVVTPPADTTPPNNVTNLTTSNVSSTTLTLLWAASTSSDIASYDVYQGATLLGNTTQATYNVSGLTASTSYTFTIKAKDSTGNISTGVSVTQTTTSVADTTAPANVTNLVTSNITAAGTTLTWTASTSSDTVGYDIYNGATLITTVAGTTYNATGLTQGTAYTFTVKAKDGAGNIATGTSVNVTTTVPDTTPPNPVTNLVVGTVTDTTVPVTWTLSTSTDVANYEVAYSSNGGTSYSVASGLVNASSTSYTVTGLTASTSYVIRLVAIDGSGNRSTPVTVNATTSAAADTTPPTVTASPAGGTYSATQTVTLSSNETATMYYTTDGTTPTYPVAGTTQTYSAPISISATATLKYIGRDVAGNVSTVQSQIYTINASGSIIVSDDFNRADSTSLGSATTGQVWTNNNASIISNQLGFAANSTVVPNLDSGISDNITIEMDLVMPSLATGNVTGISARIPTTTGNQGVNFGAKATGTKAGFTNTLTGVSVAPADANFTWVAGQTYHLKMVISGNVYTCYIDGNLIMTYTDTNSIGLTNTRHGIIMYNTTVPKADNFKITLN